MTEKAKKNEDDIDKKFLEEYQELCEKHKRGLSAVPGWRHSQDGNDFRLVVNIGVQRWE